jgi:hypothetical protein
VVYPWSRLSAARKKVIRHMITDSGMRAAASAIADEARENYGGVDVIGVGPVYSEHTPRAECSVHQQSESLVVNNLSDTVIISKDSHGHSYKLRF